MNSSIAQDIYEYVQKNQILHSISKRAGTKQSVNSLDNSGGAKYQLPYAHTQKNKRKGTNFVNILCI